jgi:hypothetical protein
MPKLQRKNEKIKESKQGANSFTYHQCHALTAEEAHAYTQLNYHISTLILLK